MEFNETWQEARSKSHLPSLCFLSQLEKQDGHSGWLAETFSAYPLKPLNVIQWNSTERKISTSSTKFVFFGRIGKTRWPPWPLIGWGIFEFSSETAEQNLTESKIFTSSTKFVFFGPIGKSRWLPWPLIGLDIFSSTSPLKQLREFQENLTSPRKPLNGIQWNLTGSKIFTSFTKFVFFGRIGKTRWPP